MEKVNKWMTIDKMFWTSLFSSIVFVLLLKRSVLYGICPSRAESCVDSVNYLALILMMGTVFLSVSVFLSMFKAKIMLFETWKNTLYIYIVLYLLILVGIPWYEGDEYIHVQKDLIALFISICYVVFSIIYILYKNHQLKS